MRLIDADALWRDAPNAYADCFENCDRCTKLDNGDLYELIEKQPTVDAVERKRGHWIKQMDELAWWYECSVCGDYPLKDAYGHESLSRFCPWCGADMRGEEHEDIPMEYYENGGI